MSSSSSSSSPQDDNHRSTIEHQQDTWKSQYDKAVLMAAATATALDETAKLRPQSRMWLQNFPDVTEDPSPRHSPSPSPLPVVVNSTRPPSLVINQKLKSAFDTDTPTAAPPAVTKDRRNSVDFRSTQYSTMSAPAWRRASEVVGSITTPLAVVQNADDEHDDDGNGREKKVTFDVSADKNNTKQQGRRLSAQLVAKAQSKVGGLRRISMFPHHFRPRSDEDDDDELDFGEEEDVIDNRTVLTLNGARLPCIGSTEQSSIVLSGNENQNKRGSFLVPDDKQRAADGSSLFVVEDSDEEKESETVFENVPLYGDGEVAPKVSQGVGIESRDGGSEKLEDLVHEEVTLPEQGVARKYDPAANRKIGKAARPLSEIVFSNLRTGSEATIEDEEDEGIIQPAITQDGDDGGDGYRPPASTNLTTLPPSKTSTRISALTAGLLKDRDIRKETIPEETDEHTPPPQINANRLSKSLEDAYHSDEMHHEDTLLAFAPCIGTAAASHKRLTKLHDLPSNVKPSEVFADDEVYVREVRQQLHPEHTWGEGDDDIPPYLRQFMKETHDTATAAATATVAEDVAFMKLPSGREVEETSRGSISSGSGSKRSSWYSSSPSVRLSIASSSGGGSTGTNRWSGTGSDVSPRTSWFPRDKRATRSSVYVGGKPAFGTGGGYEYAGEGDGEDALSDHFVDYEVVENDRTGEGKDADGQKVMTPTEKEVKLQRENDHLRNRVLELEKNLDIALRLALIGRKQGDDGGEEGNVESDNRHFVGRHDLA